MVERAEILCGSVTQPITAGFRRDGRLSIYVDQDPFYQFDSHGLLRRAYVGGFLYRSHGDTLAELHRRRTTDRTSLMRRDLTGDELSIFRSAMRQHLQQILGDLQAGRFVIRRQVPAGAKIVDRVIQAILGILAHTDEFLSNSVRDV